MAETLIIDDDEDVSYTLCGIVEGMGHGTTTAFRLAEGLKKALNGHFDVVFLDVMLPDGNGLDLVPRLQALPFPPEIIIITAFGDLDGASLALKSGVWDYVQKPFKIDEIKLLLLRVLQYKAQKKETKPATVVNRTGIVGSSPQTLSCIDLIAQASGSEVNVQIVGETGTGKELFANAIHSNSSRAGKPFVVVDCAALPEHLIESILFGHAKGAFTGAEKAQEGLVKQADGGTLFLDEVGELPFHLQKTFLRFLQERRFRPVGRKKEVESDFRLISATNRNLDQMSESGMFRQDLLHRLRALTIELPPLRQRREDINELVLYHTAKLCDKYRVGLKGFSPECFDMLANYEWPGNVREIVNILESVVSRAIDEPTLFPKHLPASIRIKSKASSWDHKNGADMAASPAFSDLPGKRPELHALINDTKRRYLKELMAETGGNISEACRISGLSRTSLYDHLKKYKIPTRN